ncbi:UNVERIFIED_CONTAM: Mitochondrial Rho GTPase 1 [Sesamum radiatum]|uniref:Mitochondrial Rho GTPase 1 n=1 Tax=Sesamum radiatum TaxID=300843 RepID=A0AAW2MZP4_SESRA
MCVCICCGGREWRGGASASGAAGNAVRIVVAGDAKTGKSSLIVTAAAENFPTNVPPVLPPTRLPEDLYPDRVPVTIIDTSSRMELFDLPSLKICFPQHLKSKPGHGIEAPIPLSTKLGDFSNIFQRIVRAAEHPHLSIPETSAGKSRKQYHRLINRSLVFVSVGAAVAIVGLAAYRVYATRRNSSS